MTDIKLFSLTSGAAQELPGTAVALEKSLQNLMEHNLDALLGIRFLASEYSTGRKHGGRIDTLGLDENGSPVIIEFKRATNENVINQGLFYLDWLLDHRPTFQLLVMEQLGKDAADVIDWSGPRLVCIAGGFTRYDAHAVQQMNRNIELIRYRRFGDDLLLLEMLNASTATTASDGTGPRGPKAIADTLTHLDGALRDLYEELRAYLLALGDDVQEKTLKNYVAFKRLKNFACVEVHPGKGCVTTFVKADLATIDFEPGFTRNVENIGHFGTGNLEITMRSRADLDKAQPLFQQSYEAN